MWKCFACNRLFSNAFNLTRHVNSHGLTDQSFHKREMAARSASDTVMSKLLTVASTRDSSVTALGTSEDVCFDTGSLDSSRDIHQEDGYDNDNLDTHSTDSSIQVPTLPPVVVDVSTAPGHVFGEEKLESDSSISSTAAGANNLDSPSSSSSSLSDESILPPAPSLKVVGRTTRSSNKIQQADSTATVAESSTNGTPMDFVDSFLKEFLGEDNSNNVSSGIAGEAPASPTKEDPMFVLPEELKAALQADSSIKVNYNLHEFYRQRGKEGYLNAPLNKKEEHQLILLKMCIDAKVPNFLYDNILKWVERAHSDGYFNKEHGSYKKRKKFIPFLSNRVFLHGFKPKKSIVNLPKAGIGLSVTFFDAEQAILSLLMDKELMKKENLNFLPGAGSSIFASPALFNPTVEGDHLKEDHVFDDFYSGSLVHVVHHTRVKLPGHETYIPLIFFIDKTHIDRHGRLCQEPICFTLGIFNRKTRAKPRAWRVLGYIPNQSMHVTAKKPVDKLGDYHVVMRHIFETSGLVAMMKNGGIYWKFDAAATDGKREGLLHFYFGTLLGDSEGHDKASGHYLSRTHHVPMLCRKCTTPYQETDNPWYEYDYLTKAQITNSDHINAEEAKRADGKRSCNQFGYHYLPNGNAFDCLDFGLRDSYSHVAHRTAFDIQHAIRMGNESRAINAFRTLVHRKNANNRKKSSKRKRNITKKLSANEQAIQLETEELNAAPEVMEDDDGNGLGGVVLVGDSSSGVISTPAGVLSSVVAAANNNNKKFIFSRIPKHVAEKAMMIWGTLLSQQSDRGLPRTYFPQGALSTDKLNCHEYPGLLLLYAVLLVSTIGIQFTGSKDKTVEFATYKRQGWLGDKHRNQWLRVLERLFLHDAFIHADSMTLGDVQLYEWYVPRYLTKIKLIVNRREGAAFKILKYHMNKHVPRDIIKYSVPNNTDTEVGESNHKDITKKTAARTQLRSKQLDWQTGHRYWENLVVSLSTSNFLSVDHNGEKRKMSPAQPTATVSSNNITPLPRGFTHCVGWEGVFLTPNKKVITEASYAEKDSTTGAFLLKERRVVLEHMGESDGDEGSSRSNKSGSSASSEGLEQRQTPKKQKKDRGVLKKISWTDDQGKSGDSTGVSLQKMLETFLCKTVSPACSRGLLRLANEVKIDGTIYRASPGRTAQRRHSAGWNDWAYAYWPWEVIPRRKVQKTTDRRRPIKNQRMRADSDSDDDGSKPTGKKLGETALNANGRLAPVHLLCFVEVKGLLKDANLVVHGNKIENDGTYAICHAITQYPPEKVAHSLLFSYAIKDIVNDNIADEYTDKNMKMYMLPIEFIRKPCVCIPDMAGPRKGNDRSYKDCLPLRATNFLVAPSSEWVSIFIQHMHDKKRRVDNPRGYDDWPDDVLGLERERREEDSLPPPEGYDSDDDPGSDYEIDP